MPSTRALVGRGPAVGSVDHDGTSPQRMVPSRRPLRVPATAGMSAPGATFQLGGRSLGDHLGGAEVGSQHVQRPGDDDAPAHALHRTGWLESTGGWEPRTVAEEQSMPAIRVRDLRKSYGTIEAVRGRRLRRGRGRDLRLPRSQRRRQDDHRRDPGGLPPALGRRGRGAGPRPGAGRAGAPGAHRHRAPGDRRRALPAGGRGAGALLRLLPAGRGRSTSCWPSSAWRTSATRW